MCFFFQISKDSRELRNRFNAEFEEEDLYLPSQFNAFQFPKTPVITNKNKNRIQLYNWGLIPPWAKDRSIQQYTLNARIETIHKKPAFRNCVNNRCLIISDGFYEWQWLDDKGKKKQKYLITLPNNEIFTIAGLWNEWVDPLTGEIVKTYTLLTMEANELMSKIHNSKKRMPVIFEPGTEWKWFSEDKVEIKDVNLIATPI